MDAIDILLGIGSNPTDDPAAMAQGLRGQKQLGDFLSMTTIPQLSKWGAAERSSALDSAKRGGVLRRTAQTRADALAQREKDDTYRSGRDEVRDSQWDAGNRRANASAARAASEAERKDEAYERGELVTLVNPADPTQMMEAYRMPGGGYTDAEGRVVAPEEVDGWVNATGLYRSRAGSRGVRGAARRQPTGDTDPGGNALFFERRADGTTDTVYADGAVYDPNDVEAIERRKAARVSNISENAAAKKSAQAQATQRAKSLTTAGEMRSGIRQTVQELQNARSALKAGAKSGPIEGRIFSFRDASIALEEASDSLALPEIAKYTFGSLSASEQAWVKDTTLNLRKDEEVLLPEVEHRLEAMERVQKANDYAIAEYEANRTPDQTVIDDIMYNKDRSFKFSDPTGAPPAQPKVSAEREAELMRKWGLNNGG